MLAPNVRGRKNCKLRLCFSICDGPVLSLTRWRVTWRFDFTFTWEGVPSIDAIMKLVERYDYDQTVLN